MLLTKRIPQSKIDLMTPNLQTKVVKRQETQKVQFNKVSREKDFKEQEKVWVRNYNGENKWIPGIIIKKTGPVSYQVTVEHDHLWKRHADQSRHRVEECVTDTTNEENPPETTVEKVPEIISEPDRPRFALETDCQEIDRPIVTAEHEPNHRSSQVSRPPGRLTYGYPGVPI